MKKIIFSLATLVFAVFLTACQSSSGTASSTAASTTAQSAETYKATLTIEFKDKTATEEITFEKGDTVMDILNEHHKISEDSGMVTEIDGVAQDAASQTYWMYDINGELAPKGASEQTVSEGDTIKFYLETFK